MERTEAHTMAVKNISRMKRRRIGLIALALTVALLVGASLGLNALAGNARAEYDAAAGATLNLERTIKLLDDMETSMRGYVISGQSSFLHPYNAAGDSLPVTLDNLRRAAPGIDAALPGQVAQITAIADQWRQQVGDPLIAQRRAGQTTQALAAASNGNGKQIFDTVRTRVSAAEATVSAREHGLADEISRIQGTTIAVVLVLAVIGLVAGSIAVRASVREGNLLTALAERADALETANEDQARREQRLTTQQHIALAASSTLDLDQLAGLTLAALTRTLACELAALYLYDETKRILRPVAGHGANLEPLALDEGPAGQAARTASRVLVEDVPEDTRFVVRPGVGAAIPRVLVCEPLIFQDRVLGVVVLGWLRPPTQARLDALAEAMAPLGVALTNTISHQRMQLLLADLSNANTRLKDQFEQLERQGEEIRTRNEELAGRNTELAAQRLELAAKNQQVERANRLKSEFLANMSHELRTPLNAILALSQLLLDRLDGELNDEQDKQVRIIHRNGQNLLGLINDVLDLSRIEAGRLEVVPVHFEIRDLIAGIEATMQALFKEKNLPLSFTIAEGIGPLYTDETKLKQALLNLLSNAAKFTEQGGIRLTVDPAPLADDRPGVRFAVIDTGIGIPESALQSIFDEFRQIESSLTRRYEGTGLGLAITKHLVAALGGEISVTSEVGKGSTFTITMPVGIMGTEAPPPAAPRSAVAERASAPDLSPDAPEVLVVDDDPEVRYILQRYLEGAGFRVLLAATGAEGLRMARDFHPRAITLDIMMPGMDGWDVLRALKADPAIADIPVVICSILDNRELGYSLGAVEYLVKPVSRQEVLAAIGRLAEGTGVRRILVVEDDETEASLLRRYLEEASYLVATAANGRQALATLRRQPVDLVTLDLMMPEMDGFSLLAEMRGDPAFRSLPVVVLTAHDLSMAEQERLRSGMALVIQKGPQRRELLLKELHRILDGERSP
jgi:signal transduction histidine kinase/DNA-binding response OmpR family regulator/CHASE3 domain sensor protein